MFYWDRNGWVRWCLEESKEFKASSQSWGWLGKMMSILLCSWLFGKESPDAGSLNFLPKFPNLFETQPLSQCKESATEGAMESQSLRNTGQKDLLGTELGWMKASDVYRELEWFCEVVPEGLETCKCWEEFKATAFPSQNLCLHTHTHTEKLQIKSETDSRYLADLCVNYYKTF